MSQPIYNTNFSVRAFDTRAEMGRVAAAEAAACILEMLESREVINVLFAAAPSQNEFLQALVNDTRIPFNRIRAFHMDEYVGLDPEAPQGFGNFLRDRLFGLAPFMEVHYLNGQADPEEEAARYTALLQQYPLDLVCMGIGENGHVAFNDPPVADFKDPYAVKKVELDPICRQQQVNDGCFASLDLVPTHALTLTVPTLMNAAHHFCIVPAPTKADAVKKTVYGPIGEVCPATMLRLVPDGRLYLDRDSAAQL